MAKKKNYQSKTFLIIIGLLIMAAIIYLSYSSKDEVKISETEFINTCKVTDGAISEATTDLKCMCILECAPDIIACPPPEFVKYKNIKKADWVGCPGEVAKTKCESKGGIYGQAGIYPIPVCQLPTSDFGKSCTDSSQCESLCVGEDITSTSGQCIQYTNVFGCMNEFYQGKVSVLCRD